MAEILSASARSPGDLLILVGADTGRDGIHGASGLASRTFEEEQEMRSAVQVGNPFLEKVLIEACLEAVQLDCVVGMQDLGAAGLASAAVEMASRGGMGLRLDVAKVPRRETGMTPYEVMLSESQERMLLAVKPGGESEIAKLVQQMGPRFNRYRRLYRWQNRPDKRRPDQRDRIAGPCPYRCSGVRTFRQETGLAQPCSERRPGWPPVAQRIAE